MSNADRSVHVLFRQYIDPKGHFLYIELIYIMSTVKKMCKGSRTFIQIKRVKALRPVHWVIVFVVCVFCTAFMLIETGAHVSYVRSRKNPLAATRALDLDYHYRQKIQTLSEHMQAECVRGISVVFAHNIEVDGTRYNDHAFHICGDKTWANARVLRSSDDNVQCQEEYANTYKTKIRPKKITFKVIDVAAWAEREVTVDMLASCQWQHAVDVLDAKW